MARLMVEAPAKVNLHLRVKNRRPDGFHELESIFAALAFGDTLYFEPLERDGALEIRLKWLISGETAPAEALPPEKNIIFRAVSLFRERTGFTQGLSVELEKRIPLGGGLGGGSSDGAAALLALNSLAAPGGEGRGGGNAAPDGIGKPGGGLLDPDSLAELAAALGSDVPFFLNRPGAAWVSGRGERIRPLVPPQGLSVVLVNPGFPSGTAEAFRLLDRYRESCQAEAAVDGPAEDALIRALAGDPRNWPFRNDFLPVFVQAGRGIPGSGGSGAVYMEILAQLRQTGADFAGLSGAGSACFGIFSDRARAEKAAVFLSKTWNFVKISFLLAYDANED